MDEHASFGYWVRRRRKALDLTQVALAQDVGCTESLIRKIESDARRPSREMAGRLAACLHIAPDEAPLFLQVARAERGVERLPAATLPVSSLPPVPPLPLHRQQTVPVPATPFVGRDQELADILRRLRDPACRLLTLVGPGGIGKTRLALQAAQLLIAGDQHKAEQAARFADGILFVPLEAVETTSALISAVAATVGFQFYENAPPRQQLLNYLSSKQLLLVLDNFEQLVASADLLAEMLALAPGLKLLVTSRIALDLAGAWFHPVAGMDFPPSSEITLPLDAFDAVQLFVQNARRTQVGFSLATAGDHVARICQLVEGMPLGLELAAAWLNVMPIEAVVDELSRSLDILTAHHAHVPKRHRSMRAVFESTWQLLSPDERGVLMQLALCRGGFDREAAKQIAGAALGQIAALVEKSLLRLTATGRYQLHELLRQFATEQLSAAQRTAAQAHHSAYYLSLLRSYGGRLVGAEQRAALDAIDVEAENLRAAWQWAVAQEGWPLLNETLDAFYNFYQIRSRYHEGEELFSAAVESLQATSVNGSAETEPLLARLLSRRGALRFFLSDYEPAMRDLHDSLRLARQQAEAASAAFALNTLGQIEGWQGDQAAARAYLLESLSLYADSGDPSGRADVLHKLAQIYGSFGDYAESQRLAEESLLLSRAMGRPDRTAYALDVLGWATICLGDYAASEAHYRASLNLFEESGDQLGRALALGGIGSVAWASGGARLPEAEATMQQSLAICRTIGHRHHLSSRLWYLAQIAIDRGQTAAAEQYAREGLGIAQEVGSRVFMAYNLCALGEAACMRGDRQSSRRYLLEVLKLAATAQHLPPLMIALLNWACLCQAEAPEQALMLLAFVGCHPACWHPFQQRAACLAAAIRVRLPAAHVATAEAAGTRQTLDALLASLLERIAPT